VNGDSKDIFTKAGDWLTEKLVNISVSIYKIFRRNKAMAEQNPFGNGKKEKSDQENVRQGKIIISPSAHDVKFADFAQIILTPTHGILKFGLHQAGTDEFVVHTQVVMPPQALTQFAEGLKVQIDRIKTQQVNPSKQPTEE
jgi:hypothetical protein